MTSTACSLRTSDSLRDRFPPPSKHQDEGYESGDESVPLAKDVFALLEHPVEEILAAAEREIRDVLRPQEDHSDGSKLRRLLVFENALVLYARRTEDNLEALHKTYDPEADTKHDSEDGDPEILLLKVKRMAEMCNCRIKTLQLLVEMTTNRGMIDMAKQSHADAVAIRRITLLALIFLPGSFVSSFFAMNLENQSPLVMSPWSMLTISWAYWAIVGPLTVLVVLGWIFLSLQPQKQSEWLGKRLPLPTWSSVGQRLCRICKLWQRLNVAGTRGTVLPVVHCPEKPVEERSGSLTAQSNSNNEPLPSAGYTNFTCPPLTRGYQATSQSLFQPGGNGNADGDESPSIRTGKRKRRDGDDNGGRFPCIFLIGDESGAFLTHTKKYEHISQLL